MKRFDPVSNKHIECLFTEAAYNAFHHDENYLDKVTVRLKSNYSSYEGSWDKVFLFRRVDEQGSDNLRYHAESYFQMKDDLKKRRHR